jgi:hypothetical protein
MEARGAGDLTGRLGHAVVEVDGPAEVDDAQDEHHEDGQDEGELDGRLAMPPATRSAHQLDTGTDWTRWSDPAEFVTSRVTV